MKVLIIGGGGREDTLAWALARSASVDQVLCAPGSDAMRRHAQVHPVAADDLQGLLDLARSQQVDLTVVGPEVPLVAGVVDCFRAAGLAIVGPTRQAAQLEGSKSFAKDFMRRHGIPTATYEVFDDAQAALDYVQGCPIPIVVKADGLAAGKGVTVCTTREQALDAVRQIMCDRVFGPAGARVVIEECLIGEEASFMALSDGRCFVPLAGAQDHKPLLDQDQGPNTGGMGAYSPAPVLSPTMQRQAMDEVIGPTIAGMAADGIPFTGVLYAGLMITAAGPKVVEFNVRFGDPETQAVIPRLKSDLGQLLLASTRSLENHPALDWDERVCVCVVMASGGYPSAYQKGLPITGIEAAEAGDAAVVFHAGTRLEVGRFVTTGGRVLGVTSFGDGFDQAISNTYQAVEKISFQGAHWRTDIGAKAAPHLSR